MATSRLPRRVVLSSLVVVTVVIVVATLALSDDDPTGPQLIMGDDVPADLRALGDETWEQFTDILGVREVCISDVVLRPVWADLQDRARYLPGTHTIELRVPATANLLRDSLVHEFAHHLEATCEEHVTLRDIFLASQGHPTGTDWFDAELWEDTPSEQWAEAVVEIVLGERQQHRLDIQISQEAIRAIDAWFAGR